MFNEILDGRWNQMVAKFFGMQTAAPTAVLTPELNAGITLQSDRPEWLYLASEKLCWALAQRAGTAAQYNYCMIQNPVNSGVLMILESVTAFVGTANAGILIISNGNTAGTTVTGACRDTRWGFPLSTGRLVTLTSVGAPVGNWEVLLNTSEHRQCLTSGPVILSPGTELSLGCGGQNVAMDVSASWRERRMLPSEV